MTDAVYGPAATPGQHDNMALKSTDLTSQDTDESLESDASGRLERHTPCRCRC